MKYLRLIKTLCLIHFKLYYNIDIEFKVKANSNCYQMIDNKLNVIGNTEILIRYTFENEFQVIS